MKIVYDTLNESQLIAGFLRLNKKVLSINGIEKISGITCTTLKNLTLGKTHSLNPEDIEKLRPIFENLGFLIPKLGEEEMIKIQKTVCKHFNVPEIMLHKNTRKHEIVEARQVAMTFSKEFIKPQIPDKKIGKFFANRDRATCLYAYKTVKNRRETEKLFDESLKELERKLLS